MVSTGFANSFTSGEISDEAWDRTDLQPIEKGFEEGINGVVRIAGPLGKRRGFWRLNTFEDTNTIPRMVPFRRSIDDALMLVFGDFTCAVWNNDGSPLMDGPGQVEFVSPYGAADLDGLRFKQVNDVIYLRHRDGLPPRTLERLSNTSWAFTLETFPNGPWRPENTDRTLTLALTGTDEADANPDNTGAGSIVVGQTVDLAASASLFDAGMVGAVFRLRQSDGSPSLMSWSTGLRVEVGVYCVSVGHAYRCSYKGINDHTITNPPTVTVGSQSDGGNVWAYRHDGAGIVRIDTVSDDMTATGTVLATVPLRSGVATSFFAEGAYSDFRGWPRMWPGIREERLVEGATAANLDFLDLTETAGFTPTYENFKPGVGSGAVVATDAVRRRIGTDGAQAIWAHEATYLIVGTASGEYLVAGSVLDEGISPTSVVVKDLSDFGSADVYPAKAHRGLIFVTRGNQTLREMSLDPGQNLTGLDLTILARHIAERGMVQLAWVPQPDETLWIRLADAGEAVMTYHKEQQVRGFTRVARPGGFVCEDLVVLPGPGRLETLWGTYSRTKNGLVQRMLWMQSMASEALFMDCAEFYEGAPVTSVGGIGHLEGETVRVLADGVQIPDVVVSGGAIALPTPASVVMVGLAYKLRFKSLKLDRQLGGSLNDRQRVVEATVSLTTALAKVGLDGGQLETVSPRTAAEVPAAKAQRLAKNVTIVGDTSRDPRIVIEDDTAYDCVIYSLKPKVAVGG